MTALSLTQQGAAELAHPPVGFECRQSLAREGAVNGLTQQSVEL